MLAAKEAELKAVNIWTAIEDVLAPVTNEDQSQSQSAPSSDTPVRLPRLFPRMTDPTGYDARFLTAKQLDNIQETEFCHRKPSQDAKMMGFVNWLNIED